jgi:predicted membrane channel-forming protein YqfA (hemolysin III family)
MAFSKFEFKGHTAEVINHIFQTLLVTYLILLLIEQIWPSTVSFYINLNYLLIAVIVSGVLDVFSKHEKKKQEPVTKKDYVFISLLGLAGFLIIKFKTVQLGWLSWVISIIAGILIILLSLLVLEEDEKE